MTLGQGILAFVVFGIFWWYFVSHTKFADEIKASEFRAYDSGMPKSRAFGFSIGDVNISELKL